MTKIGDVKNYILMKKKQLTHIEIFTSLRVLSLLNNLFYEMAAKYQNSAVGCILTIECYILAEQSCTSWNPFFLIG